MIPIYLSLILVLLLIIYVIVTYQQSKYPYFSHNADLQTK